MSLVAGTRLGPYEIAAPLGAGGMGEVYRARDTRLSREVAIKVLSGELAGDAARLKRFEKEARSASGLNHPNIVTVYDIGSEGGVSYIAMERVQGETLRNLLVSGAVPVKKLLPIATQMAEGLSKAHDAGIVHRDLKPENVMVTKDGLVKILDFGLAKPTHVGSGSDEASHLPTETGTSPGMIVGTAGYMSPEQATGESVDFRSDQFSFGSILYELATGRRAFLKKTGVDTLAAILNEEPEAIGSINPQVPAPLRWIVERCLAKDPEDRYASTKDLARELAGVRDHLSEATLPSATADGVVPRRRIRLVFVAAAAALIAIAAVVLQRGRSRTIPSPGPQFEQVTFGVQGIIHARFGPDDSIVYSAKVGGAPMALFVARRGSPESRSLGIAPATIASVSSSGEMAILRGEDFQRGTLAIASVSGDAPRDVLEDVRCASWARDGKSLAVVHVVGGKDRLEFPIGRVLFEAEASQAPSGGSIHGCGVSPDGSHVAFADGKQMAVVDLAGRITRIAPWVIGVDFAWSPGGDELWYTDYSKGVTELHAVAMDGRSRMLASLPGEVVLMDVSDKGRILLENGSGETRVLGRLAGDREERDVAWLGSSPACIGSGGGSLLYDVGGLGYGAASAVYLRKADGSTPVRLISGWGQALSPDGKWAITMRNLGRAPIVLTPTGAGSERSLPDGGLIQIGWTNWFPDGSKIVFAANAAGQPSRLYVQDVTGGLPESISPDGYTLGRQVSFVSPDGRLAFARDEHQQAVLVPTQERSSGPPRRIAGLLAGEHPVQWSEDGKWLYVSGGGQSSTVTLLDPLSGERRVWKTFAAPDPSLDLNELLVTPDGSSWVRVYGRWTSNLFFLDGVK